jgi:diguanylate cyclase (GGDEF)-like protein
MNDHSLRRILMVEDEADIQVVARLALEAIGAFQVCVCSSGKEAIEIGPAFQPDLILLDVMMPGMDGPSTFRALRELPQTATTPIIFMTAKVQPHEIVQYKALGVLDVLAKPFDPMVLPTTLAEIWKRSREAAAETELRTLLDAYAARIPEKLAQIELAWAAVCGLTLGDHLARLHRLVHGLHGSGATMGYAQLSAAAGTLERYLAPLGSAVALTTAQQAEIERLLDALRQAATARRAEPGPEPAAGARLPEPAAGALSARGASGGARDSRLIMVAGVDGEVALDLAVQLGHFGYTIQKFATLEDLYAVDIHTAPAAIIVGPVKSDGAAGQDFVTLRRRLDVVPPIICVSDRGDLETRLHAVRAGADAFFALPVNTIALIDKLDALTSHTIPEPYRILIVDDELETAHYFAAKLRAAAMLTVVVTDPLSVMQPLVEFRPDAILMDMYMPGCDGMDLAAVIRQQEDYLSIPIMFLSAETNRDMQLEAMRLGGDDFITKPIAPDHLVSAVTSRVERARVLRSFMVRDSLTGLFNHTATKERLEVELARARRHQAPMSFAIIDIDHFKLVNDTYGHPTGDRVLKSLARLLQQRLRRTDVIGRYGGEEFAVVLAGTDGPTAASVMDEIRIGLAQIRQQSGDREFSVTFSCGVAGFPGCQDAPEVTDMADQALYAAKRGGRNRVILANAAQD